MNTTIQNFRKATIIPVAHVSWQLDLTQPFEVAESLSFENAQGLLKPELFDLWRDMISKRERDEIAAVRFALVHRFVSPGHIDREEAESDDYAFKVFICLRLIKPTKSTFQRIQVKFLPEERLEVFSFQHPSAPPNVPDAESLNQVDLADLRQLRKLLPAFRQLAVNGPENIRRAVRHFNVGYSDIQDPTIQVVIWTMGIESLFASESAPPSKEELRNRIDESVGLSTDIYDSSQMREYMDKECFPVGDLLEDLLVLRDRFVHGQWVPQAWKARRGRSGLGLASSYYPDVLREAASFILRRGILSFLQDPAGFEVRA